MIQKHALVLIGEPGIGKSTVSAELTKGLAFESFDDPFAHLIYECGVWEPGRRREKFSGTDALQMNVAPMVEQYIARLAPQFIFFEGDRLTTTKFFQHLVNCGYNLTIAWLWGPTLADQRRGERAELLQAARQNEIWLKSRQTKVRVIGEAWKAQKLDASMPPAVLARLVPGVVAEVFRAAQAAGKVGA